MANEINIQAVLALQRGTLALQASGTAAPNQTNGTKGLSNYVSVTNSTSTFLSFTGLASLAYLFIKNESSVQVQLSTQSAGSFAANVFATLKQNDFCLIPINNTGGTPTIYIQQVIPAFW